MRRLPRISHMLISETRYEGVRAYFVIFFWGQKFIKLNKANF